MIINYGELIVPSDLMNSDDVLWDATNIEE